MEFIKIKTRIVNPPKDEIWDVLDNLKLQSGDIVFITSKILAIHQGRCVPFGSVGKTELIKSESTHYLPFVAAWKDEIVLTITQNTLIPSAGIDESNANNHYILWPMEQDKLCREIRAYLMKKNNLKNLAVVATDSHTTPMRMGVTGITTGLAGLRAVSDIRGNMDIFGRKLKHTRVNLIDPLTSMAVLAMGEGSEQTPIVILRNYENVIWDENGNTEPLKINPSEDLYQPLLDVFHRKGDK